MKPEFAIPINEKVLSFQDNNEFLLQSADQTRSFTNNDYQTIASICNENLIYRWVFDEILKGDPYTEQLAKDFIQKAQKGWQENNKFIFFIRNSDHQIVGAIDIKSNEPEAEIGYWLSENASGIMTNTLIKLIELAKKAGFKSLWATTKLDNKKSQNVLIRTGFKDLGEIERKGQPRRKFEFILNNS